MNGLRVFTNPGTTGMSDAVFYSRRGRGPYYRWLYMEKLAKWCGSRVIDSTRIPNSLSATAWKTVPASLQATLNEHYLE